MNSQEKEFERPKSKNNILFAEFLGRRGKVNQNIFTFKDVVKPDGDIWFTVDELNFDTDEYLLEKVVEKIKRLTIQFVGRGTTVKTLGGNFTVEISGDSCTIKDVEGGNIFSQTVHGTSKHQSVYVCCLAFINWVNNKNS